MKISLIVKQKDTLIGLRFTGENEITIGREVGSSISALTADGLSRRHAKIYEKDGKCYLEDLGSMNGSYRLGQKIEGPVELKQKDLLQFGTLEVSVDLIGEIPSAATEAAPAAAAHAAPAAAPTPAPAPAAPALPVTPAAAPKPAPALSPAAPGAAPRRPTLPKPGGIPGGLKLPPKPALGAGVKLPPKPAPLGAGLKLPPKPALGAGVKLPPKPAIGGAKPAAPSATSPLTPVADLDPNVEMTPIE